jgi:hypothetical protein
MKPTASVPTPVSPDDQLLSPESLAAEFDVPLSTVYRSRPCTCGTARVLALGGIESGSTSAIGSRTSTRGSSPGLLTSRSRPHEPHT